MTEHQRDVALAWLFRQRRRASHNADIWHLRYHREKYLNHIWQQVDNCEYRLLPPQLIRTGKQDDIVLWSAADALVMKWVALEIKDLLPLQSRCVHTAGHRGGRDSLAEITQTLAQGARFDWLGIWFDATGPTGIAPRAKENHRARRLRLEEQARRRGLSEEAVRLRVQQYEARWTLWAERQMKAALLSYHIW